MLRILLALLIALSPATAQVVPGVGPSPLMSGQCYPGGNDQFTKLLLHFDGNVTNVGIGATSPHVFTTNGTAAATGAPYFGTASLKTFTETNGNNNVSTPASSDFNLDGDFTIDYRVNIDSASGSPLRIAQASAGDIAFVASVTQQLVGSGGLSASLTVSTDGTNQISASTSNNTLGPNTYYHVAFVRSGTTIKVAINGVFGATNTVVGPLHHSSQPLYIGQFLLFGTTQRTGLSDEVRFSNGIARWNSNFTPPTAPYCP